MSPVTVKAPTARDLDSAIPERARSYLKQARDSLHAPAGAVMLAASAVDAMLKEKGLKTGSLYHRIDEAADVPIITSDMAAWAYDVRFDANEQRHSDETAALSTQPEQYDVWNSQVRWRNSFSSCLPAWLGAVRRLTVSSPPKPSLERTRQARRPVHAAGKEGFYGLRA